MRKPAQLGRLMSMHRTVLGSSIVLAGVCLTACVGSPAISTQEIGPTYDSRQIGFATRDGRSIPVVIAGNPFSGERSALDHAVLAAMYGSSIVPVVTFAVAPASTAPCRKVGAI